MTPSRVLKYRLLRHLPGRRGRRYARKYRAATMPDSQEAFLAAVEDAKGAICIDLGANVGEFTALMAKHAARVYAFEPDPWTAKRLRENLAGLDNIEVIEAAAGISEGSIQIYRHPDFESDPENLSQSSSTLSDKANVDTSKPIEVPQIDFIRFVRELPSRIAVLKIDIEGAEVDILERLFDEPETLRRIDFIFVEVHDDKIPSLTTRTDAIFARADQIERPRIDLNWH